MTLLTVVTAGLKTTTPSRAVLCPRRRRNRWCALDCAGSGLGSIPTPVPSVLPLCRVQVSSNPRSVSTAWCNHRWLSRRASQPPGKISTTNLRRRLRVVGRVDLLIGNQIHLADAKIEGHFPDPATTLLPVRTLQIHLGARAQLTRTINGRIAI